MWLIFVLIIIGIVFSFQRKNVNLFTKSSQTQVPGQFPEHGSAGTSGSITAPETMPPSQSTNNSFFCALQAVIFISVFCPALSCFSKQLMQL